LLTNDSGAINILQGKRKYGAKVPKEVWVQAALGLFKVMPVNWEEIDSEDSLRAVLTFENMKQALKKYKDEFVSNPNIIVRFDI